MQNRFVPVELFLNTAIRFRLRRSSDCTILQFQRHDVLRVPELARAAVSNSCERAATRWPPVRCEDRLPHDKHTYLSVGVSCQQLLSCGPPTDKFECIGRRRSAWCTKAELSDRADSETPRRLPHANYVLHRAGCSQEDEQF